MSSRWTRVAVAIGGPRQIAGKLKRAARTLAIRANRPELDRRLRRLQALGIIETIPTRLQIRFGGMDMLRFCILPAARAYYRANGIDFQFHYLLRFLEDPMSMLDPVGLYSDRDTIVGHLLQSVHLNPVYDLQLLTMLQGLDDLEQQAEAMVLGKHPRQATIATVIEDPDYHARLLDYVRRFRVDPAAPPPIRDVDDLRERESFRLAEATFHTLPGFMRYASRLPRDLPSLVRHRRTTRSIDPAHCDPATPT